MTKAQDQRSQRMKEQAYNKDKRPSTRLKSLTTMQSQGVQLYTFWSLNKEISIYCSNNIYAVSIKEDTAYLFLHFTRNHEALKSNMSYPEDSIRCIEDYLKILKDIERGPYFEKPLIRRIDLNQYGVSTKFQRL
ncbi:hypothetical protein Tco_0178646 [Tanacetum coccineum]